MSRCLKERSRRTFRLRILSPALVKGPAGHSKPVCFVMEEGGGGREEKLKSFEWQWGMFKSVRVMWWGQRKRRGVLFCHHVLWSTEGGLEEEKRREGQNYISDMRDWDSTFFQTFAMNCGRITGAQKAYPTIISLREIILKKSTIFHFDQADLSALSDLKKNKKQCCDSD